MPKTTEPTRRRKQGPSASRGRSRVKKISITVDARVLDEVEREARRAGRTLSTEITEALARDLRRKRLQEIIENYETEHGAISDAEIAAVLPQ